MTDKSDASPIPKDWSVAFLEQYRKPKKPRQNNVERSPQPRRESAGVAPTPAHETTPRVPSPPDHVTLLTKERQALERELVHHERVIKAAEADAAVKAQQAVAAEHAAKRAKFEAEARYAANPSKPPHMQSEEEKRAGKKQEIEVDIERLRDEQEDKIFNIVKGRSEAEMSPDEQDEVQRIKNAFGDARERKRKELRRYL